MADFWDDFEEAELDFDTGLDTKDFLSKISGASQLAPLIDHTRTSIAKKAAKPQSRRLKDKISFTAGIMNISLVGFVLGTSPENFYLLYSIKFPLFMCLRYYEYVREKMSYFLLDFCYCVNLLWMLWFFVFPQNQTLFRLLFCASNGPLLCAVLLWRNSMVFHSLDKIISIYIHLTPCLCSWAFRWKPYKDGFDPGNTPSIPFLETILPPLLLYLVWQVFYYVKVYIIDEKKIEQDKEIQTSFRFLSSSGMGLAKWVRSFPPHFQKLLFCGIQCGYTLLALIPVKLWYSSIWAHTFFLIFVIGVSAWNGASYYIEVFAKRYQKAYEEYDKQWKALADAIQAGK